ncbi:hypothetical protein D3C81_2068590 [compost metagenome]
MLGPRALFAALEQFGHIVGGGDTAAAPGSGQGGVAVAGSNVQHLLVPAQVAGLGQAFANQLQGGADYRVVTAGPRGLLTGFKGTGVQRGAHRLRLLVVRGRGPSGG